MKPLIALLLLAVASAQGAEAPADGLYLSVQDTSAPQVRSQDGKVVFLGKRQEQELQKAQLKSQDNANDTFLLELFGSYYPELAYDGHILVVAGTGYRQIGSASSGQKTTSLIFQISREDNAREVSRYLGIPIVYFRHPGYRLLTSFVPTRQSFSRADEVTVTLRIVNEGTEPVAFMNSRLNRAQRDSRYIFSAYRNGQPVPDIGKRSRLDGLASTLVLQPGAVFEDTVSLSRWFEFKDVGSYDLHGSYYLVFQEPLASVSGEQRTLSFEPIWTDYAGADFTITID